MSNTKAETATGNAEMVEQPWASIIYPTNWEGKAPNPPLSAPMTKLGDLLLSHGGEFVVFREPEDPDLEILLSRGQLFTERVRKRTGMEPHECHMNAAELWAQDPQRCKLVTGYALGGDRWRQHSWCRDDKGLVETTVKCDKYFGAVLDDAFALDFWLFEHLLVAYPVAAKMLVRNYTTHGFALAQAGLKAGLIEKALDKDPEPLSTKGTFEAVDLAYSMMRNAS
jgi:hypothetical protein